VADGPKAGAIGRGKWAISSVERLEFTNSGWGAIAAGAADPAISSAVVDWVDGIVSLLCPTSDANTDGIRG